ncbi:NAD(P)H-dependent oxidoreductase [Enterococcus sp. 669A]|uniref:NAD(P)H-dependent oxidoreductase n=1 Tax=Candidatus Enterococcus moelleringii TaxID=2815325 RepID=A0ABS3L8T9_9ENTE|nr:flavodoxin [Enterococcus sp. 669A]MBO1306059.1 NAD(P)H-dependent oxidoreductase [Enterococcus sp. 669A]
MMKRKLFTCMTLLLVGGVFAGCSGETNTSVSSQNSQEESTAEESNQSENSAADTDSTQASETGSNLLIAYFSRVGNTEFDSDVDVTASASLNEVNGEMTGNATMLADAVQEATGGDQFLIETVEAYPSDYNDTTDQASEEQSQEARPELSTTVENMDQYDTVILVYPNWWGSLPMPVASFLEAYDFSGKTIAPVCTHEGSRLGSSQRDIAALCPDAQVNEGLAIHGSDASNADGEIQSWLAGLDL